MGSSPQKNRVEITRPTDRIFVIRYRNKFLEKNICKNGQVVSFGKLPYTLHPFQAVVPQDPKFMEYAVNLVTKHKNFSKDFDTIFTLAQRSIPLGVYFSQKTRKPLSVAYSREYQSTNSYIEKNHFQV